MKRTIGNSLALVTLLLFSAVLSPVMQPGAEASSAAPTSPAAADAMTFLPSSDALVLVDVRRLLNETLPRIFANDAAKLMQANAEIDKFKARTGIDPRSFDRVVLGMRYTYPSPKVTKVETVAIAHGTFDAKALFAAGRIAASGKYREEKHRGTTIAVFSIDDQIKALGLWNMKVNEMAVAALDANTLAMGSVANVRAAIDAGRAGRRANADLAALASRDPNAVIGFGGKVLPALLESLDVGNDTVEQDIKSIRQVYGSMGTTQTDVSVFLTARTDSPAAANNLSDTVTGLKQLGSILIMRMAPEKKALAQSALDNLKITTRGNEMEIRTQVAAASLASIVK